MEAIGRDGKWHPWDELTKEEQDEWMEAMTEVDRIHDYYKTHERPLTLKQNLMEYEAKRRVMARRKYPPLSEERADLRKLQVLFGHRMLVRVVDGGYKA